MNKVKKNLLVMVFKDSEKPVFNVKEVEMITLKNKLFVINEIKK